jgi:hypothetical protein
LVNDLEVSPPDAELPFALGGELQPDLPGLGNSLKDQSIPGLEKVALPETGLGEAGEQISQYEEQLSALPSNIEEASSLAEEQAMKVAEAGEVSDQLGEVGKVSETGSLPAQQDVKEGLVQCFYEIDSWHL